MALVVSHIDSDFGTLAANALRQSALGDLVELRLDRVGHPGNDALARFISECPKQVIVTVHGAETGGDFAGTREEHLELLRDAARCGAAFVDVDCRDSLALGEVGHLGRRCHRIVSRHEDGPVAADATALAKCVEEMEEVLYEGDVIKFVAYASSTEDGLRVLRLLRERGGGLVAFASGPAGSFTRVLAPIFGSPLTYAAPIALPGLPDPEPTAAGQLAVNEILSLWPPGGVTPGTAVYGVVGKSVANSLSPFVQGMALKAAHVDAVFLAFETDDLAAFLALADDENFRGFSVTAPHKCAALAVSVSSDDPSRAAGAANTLLRERTAWRAANTDVPAIADTLERAAKYADVDLRGAPALVIGTGGAARAATLALTRAGAQVTVAGRREDAARDLAAQLGCEAMAFDPEKARNFACIVHTTPVGTQAPTSGDQSSGSDHDSLLRSVHISPGTLVLDAVYRPIRTPLLMAAKEAGAVSIPGAEWFVRQAALQFQLFTGQEPDEDLMRSAFEGALEQASAAGGTLARGV